MVWDTYVNVNLVGTGKIKQAAIFGLGAQLQAASAGFNVGCCLAEMLPLEAGGRRSVCAFILRRASQCT